MTQALLVGFGGMLGSILRFWLNTLMLALIDYPFPFGILLINTLGCLLIGFFSGLAETGLTFTPEIRLFLFVGIFGGFTTFSTFGYDTFSLLQHEWWLGLLNIILHLVIALPAVWVGYTVARIG